MENIIKKDNITEYYIDGRLLLTVTELPDNQFITENEFTKLEGYCKHIDEYRIYRDINQNRIYTHVVWFSR